MNTDTDLHAAVMTALAQVDDPEMGENLVDLGRETPANLELVAMTPSSGLGTVRKKPSHEDCIDHTGAQLKNSCA